MTSNIWSDLRRSPALADIVQAGTEPMPSGVGDVGPSDHRSAFQRDYDRVLFSTPVRRLSDKTQVWPMDENDGVRTRLTHSHEVANLAKSIGSRVFKKAPTLFGGENLYETVQPILSAIGLAHDLGNPPFGHQGESAIKGWFDRRKNWIFSHSDESHSEGLKVAIPSNIQADFLQFDGNPQSLRLLAKLQTSMGRVGLDLTAATLAASLKYPVRAENLNESSSVSKKVGYFESERALVDWFRKETGIKEGERHPLTWIMESCDDIAYSVLDVEDAMKKGVVSPDDVFTILKQNASVPSGVIEKISSSFAKVSLTKRRPEITRDIKVSYLKAHFLDALVDEATEAFLKSGDAVIARTHKIPLMDASALCDALKKLAKQYAFSNSGVLRMEAIGAAAIEGLLTKFWCAIDNRKDKNDLLSRRKSAVDAYVFSFISQNYLEDAVHCAGSEGPCSGMRYRELRLLTDMISGMTDTFAVKLWNELKALN